VTGRKVWIAGEILAAADVNSYLMDQSVMVFADATAREDEIASPAEGMFAYLTGSNALTLYNGSAWVGADTSISKLATLITDATTSRTLVATDGDKTIRFTNGSATTLTINASTDLAVGARVDLLADGAGALTITASSATVAGDGTSTTSGSFTIGGRYSAATVLCIATDDYRLIGNVTAV